MSHITPADVPDVVKLSAGLHEASTVLEDVERCVEAKRDPLAEGGTPLSALVAKCAGQVVGVAVMRDEKVRDFLFCVSTPLLLVAAVF